MIDCRASREAAAAWPAAAGLGLYLHIPFCERKCPYCDFNTYAGLHAQFDALVHALVGEMERWRTPLQERVFTSVFVGGGTPTVLEERQLDELFAALRANFTLAAECEITCEANPGTVDRDRFVLLRELGVNRLSMGVQSLQPEELRFLGRIHDVDDVYAAFAAARQAGFANINLDFIFGLPQQRPEAWQDTLTQALALGPEHFSLYSLIVEPGTPLHRWVAQGRVEEPDDDLAAELYEAAMQRLAGAGYVQYEVSNWARGGAANEPVQEPEGELASAPHLACRHNLLYWRNEEYLGIGPGAHSHLWVRDAEGRPVERRWGNRKPVGGYIQRVRAGAPLEEFTETIDAPLAMGETMMLGLRLLREGVSKARFAQRHGQALEATFGPQLAKLKARGLIVEDGERVRLSPAGLLLGNQVFAEFLPG